MKTSLSRIGQMSILGYVAIVVSFASRATELLPSATMQITPSGASSVRVTVTNGGDQVWIIQRSSDLINWSEAGEWKVHNGSFHSTFSLDPLNPNVFFRAVYDPARQDILSTAANAVLLPNLPFKSLASAQLSRSTHCRPG